jgi:hypothetical protein
MKYSIKVAGLALMPVAFGGALALSPGATSPASAHVDHGYTGHEPSAWSRVIHRCHCIGCTSHLSHAIRHELGISDHQPVRVHYGDTTWIWAKGKHGIVRTFNS